MNGNAASTPGFAASSALAGGFERLLDLVASMTRGDWIAIAIAAVLFFWALGAYNRLVALRRAVAEAWAPAADVLRRRHEAVRALLAALQQPLTAEQSALDALQQALAAGEAATEALSARPLLRECAAAWMAAEATFNAAAARVTALAGAAVNDDGEVTDWSAALAALGEAQGRLPFVRQFFNDAAGSYDEALALFPTSLAARVFGFGPAGRV